MQCLRICQKISYNGFITLSFLGTDIHVHVLFIYGPTHTHTHMQENDSVLEITADHFKTTVDLQMSSESVLICHHPGY